MIVATGRDTGMPAYIFVKEIQKVESMRSGPCSFTRVFLEDKKENHEYFLDVTESREEISRRIRHERHIPGRGAENHEEIS